MNNATRRPVLGQASDYPRVYSPGLLLAVPRADNRARLLGDAELPWTGVDIWNAYELSWLNARGKPVAAIGQFIFPAASPNLIESKSLKLYLNSLNQHRFESSAQAGQTIGADLSAVAGEAVTVEVTPVSHAAGPGLTDLPGHCLDALDIDITDYDVTPALLDGAAGGAATFETVHSHLFKSNCPVTGQPDWASILVRYRGPAMDHAHLLRYLVSYRNCSAFHEDCVERVFVDLLKRCRPEALTVYARYTRRGGLDINPFRSNFEKTPENLRLLRQ